MVARSQPRWQTPDWKRDLAQAFTRPAELLDHLGLAPSLAAGSDGAARQFPLLVPRGFADLMEPGNADDPLLRQVLPLARETAVATGYVADPVADTAASIAPGLLQKYAHRALLITTGACAIHCRYCFRRHFPYGAEARRGGPGAAVAALAARPDIDEAILSGGDPLMLDDSALADLVGALGDIPHLKRLRLHTRLPVVLPSRVTTALCALLADCRLETIVVVHANHPAELGDAAAAALRSLGERRLPLLNQSVLLRGVNDSPAALAALSERLFELGVHPYYLHLLDPVAGAAHFEIPRDRALWLMAQLRNRLPGYLVPRLALEVPGAASKITLA
jgi:EF-P beta-lysylation protein EpmB